MRTRYWLVVIAVLMALSIGEAVEPESRQRIIVLTDLSNEPDDEESLVRFLV